MQDYRVHIKHMDGSFEYVPYFCLPANDLNDVIAPSCYSCFDYPNALADLVGPFATSLFWSDQTSLCKLFSACCGPSEGALEANCHFAVSAENGHGLLCDIKAAFCMYSNACDIAAL